MAAMLGTSWGTYVNVPDAYITLYGIVMYDASGPEPVPQEYIDYLGHQAEIAGNVESERQAILAKGYIPLSPLGEQLFDANDPAFMQALRESGLSMYSYSSIRGDGFPNHYLAPGSGPQHNTGFFNTETWSNAIKDMRGGLTIIAIALTAGLATAWLAPEAVAAVPVESAATVPGVADVAVSSAASVSASDVVATSSFVGDIPIAGETGTSIYTADTIAVADAAPALTENTLPPASEVENTLQVADTQATMPPAVESMPPAELPPVEAPPADPFSMPEIPGWAQKLATTILPKIVQAGASKTAQSKLPAPIANLFKPAPVLTNPTVAAKPIISNDMGTLVAALALFALFRRK